MKTVAAASILSLLFWTNAVVGLEPHCNICGGNQVIGDVEGIVIIDGVGNRTCVELQQLGDDGIITPEQCTELQPHADEPCDCIDYICPICGENGVSTKPDGLVDIPGLEAQTTCAAVYQVAQAGGFNDTFCETVQDIVEDPCGCVPQDTDSPTESPTRQPTTTPVTPTDPPTSAPTRDTSGANSASVVLALAATLLYSSFAL